MKALFEEGSSDVNIEDNLGNTALILASNKGQQGCVEFLVEQAGFDIDHTNKQGQTALIRASMKGLVPTIRYLVMSGANVDIRDDQGFTALERAIDLGLSSSLEILTDYYVASDRMDDVVAAKDALRERKEVAAKIDVEL